MYAASGYSVTKASQVREPRQLGCCGHRAGLRSEQIRCGFLASYIVDLCFTPQFVPKPESLTLNPKPETLTNRYIAEKIGAEVLKFDVGVSRRPSTRTRTPT